MSLSSDEREAAVADFMSIASFNDMLDTPGPDGRTPAETYVAGLLAEVAPVAEIAGLSTVDLAEAMEEGRWYGDRLVEAARLIRAWAAGADPDATSSALLEQLRQPWPARH